MPWWIPVVAPILAAIVTFFLLPALEPSRQKFLRWIGIRPAKEPIMVKSEIPHANPPAAAATLLAPPAPAPTVGPAVDPGMIYAAMDAAPLLQQRDAVKHFVGLKVDWSGTLKNIFKTGTETVYINVAWNNELVKCFTFEVDEKDYPGLGLLKDKDRIRVIGTIKDVEIPYPIRLKNVTMVEYGKKEI